MFVLPFLQPIHNYPIPGFYTEVLAFALGMVALGLLLLQRYWREVALPQIAFAPMGLFAVLLLQWALGMPTYAQTVLIALLYLLWTLFLMLLGGVLRRHLGLRAISITLAWFLLVGGELSALAGILQHYHLHSWLDHVVAAKRSVAVFGNLAQPNHFANYTALALASLIYLRASGVAGGFGNRPYMTGLTVLAASPLLFVLGLSSSRSSWLYLLALLMLAGGWLWRNRVDIAIRNLVVSSVALLAGFALAQWLAQTPYFVAPSGAITASDRLFDLASGNSIRFLLHQEAWAMFWQSPLLGIGFGQFAWHHFQMGALFDHPEITGIYNHAHNLLMQLLAETGLVGTLPLLVVGAIWLRGCWHRVGDLDGWWSFSLLTIIGIHSMLEFPLWYAHFLGIAAFLLGITETRLVRLDLQRSGRFAVALMLLLGAMSLATMTQSYYRLQSLFFSLSTSAKAKLSEAELEQALQQLYQESLLVPYAELFYAASMTLNADRAADKLALNERVMRFAPARTTVYKQSILLTLNGRHAEAALALERAFAAHPDELAAFAAALPQLAAENPGSFDSLIKLASIKLQENKSGVRTK